MTKAEISKAMGDRLHLYRSQRHKVRQTLQRDAARATAQKARNQDLVADEIRYLRSEFAESVLSLIKSAKSHVSNPLEFNEKTACYYLFGKASNNLRAALLLLENGLFYDAMELLRSAGESSSLVRYFLMPGSKLNEWFSGNIIPQREVRKLINKSVNQKTGLCELRGTYGQNYVLRLERDVALHPQFMGCTVGLL